MDWYKEALAACDEYESAESGSRSSEKALERLSAATDQMHIESMATIKRLNESLADIVRLCDISDLLLEQ